MSEPRWTLPDWPLFGLADDARPALAAARETGEAAALATITALDSGGPRPVGTQMVLAAGGAVSGFLSGGCLEADVAGHAAQTLTSGASARLIYGEGSPWPDIRLMCGARIDILLERIAPDDAAVGTLLTLWRARRPAVWLSDGARRACAAAEAPPDIWPGAYRKLFAPTPRLIVLGADPTALAIAALGVHGGWETTLVRPKGPAEAPPIPGLAYRRDDGREALAAIGLDPWTAVAAATHDAELDHDALTAALPSPAFYVGALGARRRRPERTGWLAREGLAPETVARLHTPIGLELGGKAPWEVAIAVLAQITAVWHGRDGAAAGAPSATGESSGQ